MEVDMVADMDVDMVDGMEVFKWKDLKPLQCNLFGTFGHQAMQFT